MTIRVLIADDHKLIRQALADLLSEAPDITVVAECSDGAQVVAAAAATGPDVVLMDLQMPVMDGLQATRELLASHPEVRVVVLTGGLTPATALEARALGVAGYLLKEEDPGELPDRIRTVASGGTVWNPAAAALAERGADCLADPAAPGTSSTYVEESPHRYR